MAGHDPSTRSTGGRKPRLLLLYPGPVHDLASYYGYLLEGLSRDYAGSVLVTGIEPDLLQVGEFDVVRLGTRGRSRLDLFLALRREAMRMVQQGPGAGPAIDMIVTYDPLRSGLLGAWLARHYDVPLIVELNGDYTSRANYLDDKTPFARWWKRKLFVAIERHVLRRASGIKVLYPEMLDPFRSHLKDPVIRTIPAVPDLRCFRHLGEDPEVLLVGHPYYLKGVDLLIEAFKRVVSSHPHWRLKILGWFPDPRELHAAIGGHPRIQLHPPVSHEEVARHMGRCGIFVLPSRTEAMGRVLLEAAACGKPRIGSRVGGIPTVIEDGVDGLLFDSGNVGELAAHLDRLMGDPEFRHRLGSRAQARVESEFSLSTFFDRTREFYDAVLTRGQHPVSVPDGSR